ncbi:hypothetical protein ACWGB8_01815 [Kitasatospora sp. NPDC054939]
MRPARFQQLLLDAAGSLSGVAAKTLADTGDTQRPFGVAVEAGGRTSRWQITAMRARDEKWGDHPDPEPTLGEKPAGPEAPKQLDSPATVEHALVAALLAADPGEIAAVEIYSAQPTPPVVGHGATITFHDGAKAFINHIR